MHTHITHAARRRHHQMIVTPSSSIQTKARIYIYIFISFYPKVVTPISILLGYYSSFPCSSSSMQHQDDDYHYYSFAREWERAHHHHHDPCCCWNEFFYYKSKRIYIYIDSSYFSNDALEFTREESACMHAAASRTKHFEKARALGLSHL